VAGEHLPKIPGWFSAQLEGFREGSNLRHGDFAERTRGDWTLIVAKPSTQ